MNLSARQFDNTLTPLDFINGIAPFDLDPCGYAGHQTATEMYCLPNQCGLYRAWDKSKRVWLNPPYSNPDPWLFKLWEHSNGIALVLASTDSLWFQGLVFDKAHAIKFLLRKVQFQDKEGEPVFLRHAVCLVAYGEGCADIVEHCEYPGKFFRLKEYKPGTIVP